jgi:hypothetical protein
MRFKNLHEEESHKFYSSVSTVTIMASRRIRWVGQAERVGDVRNVYKILDRQPKAMISLEGSRRRWEGITKVDLGKVVMEVVDWIHLLRTLTHARLL